jgi:hypothetical protein
MVLFVPLTLHLGERRLKTPVLGADERMKKESEGRYGGGG